MVESLDEIVEIARIGNRENPAKPLAQPIEIGLGKQADSDHPVIVRGHIILLIAVHNVTDSDECHSLRSQDSH